jgi:hypothetical protein
MKNMSPSVTRPGIVVTKTVSTPPRVSAPMKGNDGPNCSTVAQSGDRITGIEDKVLRPVRTVYENGF